MSESLKKVSLERLAKMDKDDQFKRQREQSYNSLEAFVYKARDFLELNSVQSISNPIQRAALASLIEVDIDWLAANSDSAVKEEIDAKLAAITDLHSPLKYRLSEMEGRKDLVSSARKTLDEIRAWYESAVQNHTATVEKNAASNSTDPLDQEQSMFTLTELEGLASSLVTMETWLDTTVTEQEALSGDVDPILTKRSVHDAIKIVYALYTDLLKRKPILRKAKKMKASTTINLNSTESTSTTIASDSTTVEQHTSTLTPSASESSVVEDSFDTPILKDEGREDL